MAVRSKRSAATAAKARITRSAKASKDTNSEKKTPTPKKNAKSKTPVKKTPTPKKNAKRKTPTKKKTATPAKRKTPTRASKSAKKKSRDELDQFMDESSDDDDDSDDDNDVDLSVLDTHSVDDLSESESEGEDVEIEGLYEALESGVTSVQTIVNHWVDLYARDSTQAVLDLVNLIVSASACPKLLTVSQFEEQNLKDVLEEFARDKEFKKVGPVYPFNSRKKSERQFVERLLRFWDRLVDVSRDTILFDGDFILKLMEFVNTASASNVRSFRHTATAIAMRLIHALLRAAKLAAQECRTLEEQLEKLEASKTKKKAGAIETLNEQIEDVKANVQTLESFVLLIFEKTFVLRFRDKQPDIRCLCIESLPKWMCDAPEIFLTDAHAKYVGWLLYDSHANVRVSTLRGLKRICANEDFVSHLHTFLERFRPRVVELTRDVDNKVAKVALEVIDVLVKNGDENVPLEDIYLLAHDARKTVREGCARIVLEHVVEPAAELGASQIDVSGDTVRDELRLRAMIEFLADSPHKERPHWFVDALWGATDVLTKWETMVDLLREEAATSRSASFESLSEEHQNVLAQLLHCCVAKASNEPLFERSRRANEKDAQVDEWREDYSETICLRLGDMVKTFSAQPVCLTELFSLVLYVDLTNLAVKSNMKQTKTLVNELKSALVRHNDADLLFEAARALSTLTACEHTHVSTFATVAREKVFDELRVQLTGSLNNELSDKKKLSTDANRSELRAVLCRINQMLYFHPTTIDVWPDCSRLLQRALDIASPEAVELARSSLPVMLLVLTHERAALVRRARAGEPQESEIAETETRARELVGRLVEFLEAFALTEDTERYDVVWFVRLEALATLCRVLPLFANSVLHETAIHGVIVDISAQPRAVEAILAACADVLDSELYETPLARANDFEALVGGVLRSLESDDEDEDDEEEDDDESGVKKHGKRAGANNDSDAFAKNKNVGVIRAEIPDAVHASVNGWTDPRREILVEIGRCVTTKALPSDAAALVLSRYTLLDKLCREAIRDGLLAYTRRGDPLNDWEAIFGALRLHYDQYLSALETGEAAEETLARFKQLAKKLAPTLDMKTLDKSMYSLVEKSVNFVWEDVESRGAFVRDGIAPVVHRMDMKGARAVLVWLDKRLGGVDAPERNDDTRAFFDFVDYVRGLVGGENPRTPGTASKSASRRTSTGGRKSSRYAALDLGDTPLGNNKKRRTSARLSLASDLAEREDEHEPVESVPEPESLVEIVARQRSSRKRSRGSAKQSDDDHEDDHENDEDEQHDEEDEDESPKKRRRTRRGGRR